MDIESIKELMNYTRDLTLLYVEDEEEIRNSTILLLKTFFINIIVAKDGEDGLNKFQENDIDIVISDINMPKIDGLEMVEKILEIDKNVITIIFSAYSESDYFLKTIELGINGYLLKPIESEQFIKVLQSAVEKRKKTKEYEKNLENINLLRQYHDITDKSTIVSKTDKRGVITYVNKNFCDVSGFEEQELIGKTHRIIKHPDNAPEMYEDMWETIAHKKQQWQGILKNRTKRGKAYYVKSTIKPILNEKGEVIEYIALRDNISSIMSDQKQLMDKIETSNLSLLALIQIQEFEMLDKFYNLALVDQIEKKFGFEMLTHFPDSFIFENVYNLGNGKYALLTDFFNFERANISIDDYFRKFVNNIKNSILTIDDIEYDLNITLSYSMGKYMLFEDAKCGLEHALANNESVYMANDASIYEHKKAKCNMEIIRMIKIALENYKIISYFQPIINNKTKKIEKYESLVRLINEEGEVLSPFHFLHISKKGNYYNKITLRVLENSFKILHYITTDISINLSITDIEKEETREKLYELLEENKKDAKRVVFELLEDENIKDHRIIRTFIKRVKAYGVRIAIDDFGAGYSNFERLADFEPDILKIDGSLIKNIERDNFSRNIVETIVTFAKKQNIKVIAEYVENEKIFNILNDLGVDYSQGYYFGKPEELKIDF